MKQVYFSSKRLSMASELACYSLFQYRWTSLQRPPCGQKKVTIVERLKQEWMYGLFRKKKKIAVLERWPLVEVRL